MLIVVLNFLIILFSFNLIAMEEEEEYEKLIPAKTEKIKQENLEDNWSNLDGNRVDINHPNPLQSIPQKIVSRNNNLKFVSSRVTTDQRVFVFAFEQEGDSKAKQVEFVYYLESGQITQMKD